MQISRSTTFAFSKRQDRWTTRYSFTPTCYANCGDIMLSSKDASGVWRHDVNEDRNNFYGVQSRSSLDIVSNDDPSAVKIFKSISLETNQDGWGATFYTNDEDKGKNRQQSNTVYGFDDKEGFKYLEVPRSKENSTSNIIPCPSLSFIEGAANNIFSTIGQIQYSFALQYFDSVVFNLNINNPQYIAPPLGTVYALINGELVSFNQAYPDALNPSGIPDIQITAVNDGSVQVTSIKWSEDDLSIDDYIEYLSEFLQNPLFVVTPAETNGDQMRGPYLRTRLFLLTNKPVELHAVNIDYEFSKLDKRLTQNT